VWRHASGVVSLESDATPTLPWRCLGSGAWARGMAGCSREKDCLTIRNQTKPRNRCLGHVRTYGMITTYPIIAPRALLNPSANAQKSDILPVAASGRIRRAIVGQNTTETAGKRKAGNVMSKDSFFWVGSSSRQRTRPRTREVNVRPEATRV
jgi:hypothetical protein